MKKLVRLLNESKRETLYNKSLSVKSMQENISKWYKSAFPTDKEYKYIDTEITFIDIFEMLMLPESVHERNVNRRNIDALLGNDSIIRERVFQEICERMKIDYDEVYYAWIEQ